MTQIGVVVGNVTDILGNFGNENILLQVILMRLKNL